MYRYRVFSHTQIHTDIFLIYGDMTASVADFKWEIRMF